MLLCAGTLVAAAHGKIDGLGPIPDNHVEGNLTVGDSGRASGGNDAIPFPNDRFDDDQTVGECGRPSSVEAAEPSAAVIPLLSNTEDWIALALLQLQDPNLELNSVFAIPTNVLKDILSSLTCTASMFRQTI